MRPVGARVLHRNSRNGPFGARTLRTFIRRSGHEQGAFLQVRSIPFVVQECICPACSISKRMAGNGRSGDADVGDACRRASRYQGVICRYQTSPLEQARARKKPGLMEDGDEPTIFSSRRHRLFRLSGMF